MSNSVDKYLQNVAFSSMLGPSVSSPKEPLTEEELTRLETIKFNRAKALKAEARQYLNELKQKVKRRK